MSCILWMCNASNNRVNELLYVTLDGFISFLQSILLCISEKKAVQGITGKHSCYREVLSYLDNRVGNVSYTVIHHFRKVHSRKDITADIFLKPKFQKLEDKLPPTHSVRNDNIQ